MKKLLFYLQMIPLMYSCSDDENIIDKDQITLGIWFYEYPPSEIPNLKSTTLTFSTDGTYIRENVVYSPMSPSGTDTVTKEGTWFFVDNNIIDLTGYGSCVQPVGEPPCVPPDIDFKIIELTKEWLEVEELYNGSTSSKIRYKNIKP